MGEDGTDSLSPLMDKIRRGNKQAFEELFKKYYFNLSRFAWRYVNSKAIAEEIVQEVYADLWEQRRSWEGSGSVRAYLYQAVKHRALDHERHQKIKDKYDPEWGREKEHPTIDFKDEHRIEEIRKAIKREIEALPPRSKMTFKLHRFDGLTYREIAQVMDVSVKTVESQMSRTLKRLRSELSHFF